MRIYHIDLLDFYRGKLSARRIRVLLRQLPIDAALRRALNDGKPAWSPTDHLLADLWTLTLTAATHGKSTVDDHPVRAAMEAAAKAAALAERLAALRADFNRRKSKYKKAFGR